MLRGAMRELTIGRPDSLDVDIGPVISAEAQAALHAHIQTMRERGHKVEALPLPDETRHGTFVARADFAYPERAPREKSEHMPGWITRMSTLTPAKAGGMAALGVARLGDTKLLANAGADLVVWSLDEVSRPALAEGLLERKRNREA